MRSEKKESQEGKIHLTMRKNEKDLNFIISKDYEIHKKEININTKYTDKVLTIDTSGLAMKEVLNTAYDWSLN